MWTTENRGRYERSKQRYPSDMTDEEWALIPPAKRGGNNRTVSERYVVDCLVHILSTGCLSTPAAVLIMTKAEVKCGKLRWDWALGRLR